MPNNNNNDELFSCWRSEDLHYLPSCIMFFLLWPLFNLNAIDSTSSRSRCRFAAQFSLSGLFALLWLPSTSECKVSIGFPPGSRIIIIIICLLLAPWKSGNNYGMSGGSPWLMDNAICSVFFSLLVQLALKRQKRRRPCDMRGWRTLFSSLGIEMQSSVPAVSGDGC